MNKTQLIIEQYSNATVANFGQFRKTDFIHFFVLQHDESTKKMKKWKNQFDLDFNDAFDAKLGMDTKLGFFSSTLDAKLRRTPSQEGRQVEISVVSNIALDAKLGQTPSWDGHQTLCKIGSPLVSEQLVVDEDFDQFIFGDRLSMS
uniref:Uncharacterized protein n=1 Tax=Romanomermis culicivorax TaxID=13658 RepID=A0A915L7M3_ROMCU